MDESSSSATPSNPGGHRARLRARLLAGDAAAFSDEALLELALTYAIPRRDVKPIAQALLARFGDVASVLSGGSAELKRVKGISDTSVALLKLIAHLKDVECTAQEDPTPPPDPVREESVPTPRHEETAPSEVPPAVAETPATKSDNPVQPKLQVSNGYSFDAAQNAQLLTYIVERPTVRKFARRDMMEGTGLSEGQTESLASIGAAIGLVTPRTTVLTPYGKLVAHHDLFLDSPLTLEFCHFLGAGNPRNLIWFTIFNDLLGTEKPTDQAGWSAWLREKLAGQYTPRSLVKHVAHEVRFVLDAYSVKNFKKLNLLFETPDKTLALRRYTALQPQSLAAMIYRVGEQHEARLVSFRDLQAEPGSPGRVFGLDASSMRQMIEVLHQKGWIRYEVRHGLDQIRLVDGFDPLEFLAAGYENREPSTKSNAKPDKPGEERLLL